MTDSWFNKKRLDGCVPIASIAQKINADCKGNIRLQVGHAKEPPMVMRGRPSPGMCKPLSVHKIEL